MAMNSETPQRLPAQAAPASVQQAPDGRGRHSGGRRSPLAAPFMPKALTGMRRCRKPPRAGRTDIGTPGFADLVEQVRPAVVSVRVKIDEGPAGCAVANGGADGAVRGYAL